LRAHCGLPGGGFAIERCTAQYCGMRRIARGGVVIAAGFGALAACHAVPRGGLAERCADVMRQAYPVADIDVTERTAVAKSLTTVVARVVGERTNLPANAAIARHLAVECTFDNDVLTGFRWTAGPR
jgi:hypothetical protein